MPRNPFPLITLSATLPRCLVYSSILDCLRRLEIHPDFEVLKLNQQKAIPAQAITITITYHYLLAQADYLTIDTLRRGQLYTQYHGDLFTPNGSNHEEILWLGCMVYRGENAR